jgi:hypothetical protein
MALWHFNGSQNTIENLTISFPSTTSLGSRLLFEVERTSANETVVRFLAVIGKINSTTPVSGLHQQSSPKHYALKNVVALAIQGFSLLYFVVFWHLVVSSSCALSCEWTKTATRQSTKFGGTCGRWGLRLSTAPLIERVYAVGKAPRSRIEGTRRETPNLAARVRSLSDFRCQLPSLPRLVPTARYAHCLDHSDGSGWPFLATHFEHPFHDRHLLHFTRSVEDIDSAAACHKYVHFAQVNVAD